jgi:hypothetical protein
MYEHVVAKGNRNERRDLLNARLFRCSVLAGQGDHARATDEVGAVARREGLSPDNLYNIACVFGRSSAAAAKDAKLPPADRVRLKTQYADRALKFLRQAVAKGYESAPTMMSEPDLAPLCSRADFQGLVQDVEQKSKK